MQTVTSLASNQVLLQFASHTAFLCTWQVVKLTCSNFSIGNHREKYVYNFDPLKPHFYKVKLGFTGVYITFLISAQKHRLWVLVRTASPSTTGRLASSLDNDQASTLLG